mmetsp:Transcript_6908/g.23590  ORF Transcript_6908/g.23590 Transcript_6908/m.23590 type:complete len:223 (+) Transcript_6908:46-714(+)
MAGRAVGAKELILVRHGESMHNISAVHAYGDTGADEALFDAPLSPAGRAQADSLTARFALLCARTPVELAVVSPLTRAVETYVAAFPQGRPGMRTEVWAEAREHLTDSCDIGSPPAVLAKRFPWLSFAHLPAVWWYVDEETSTTDPEDSRRRYREFGFMEPDVLFRARVDACAQRLRRRPERRIALFGHSDFLNDLLERHLGVPDKWLENAEVFRAELPAGS